MAIRTQLTTGDAAGLERFLAAHADSSMFLRGNARAADAAIGFAVVGDYGLALF